MTNYKDLDPSSLVKFATEGETEAIEELRDRQASGDLKRVWVKPRSGPEDDGVTGILVNAARGVVSIKVGRAGSMKTSPEMLGWWVRVLCGAMAGTITSAVKSDDMSVDDLNHVEHDKDFAAILSSIKPDLFCLTFEPRGQLEWKLSTAQVIEFIEVVMDFVWDSDLSMDDLKFTAEESELLSRLTLVDSPFDD